VGTPFLTLPLKHVCCVSGIWKQTYFSFLFC